MDEKTEQKLKDDYMQMRTEFVEMRSELSHMRNAVEVMTQTLGRLSERMNTLEMRLAVNDVHTQKNTGWVNWVATGIGTILIGYIAVKVGLK